MERVAGRGEKGSGRAGWEGQGRAREGEGYSVPEQNSFPSVILLRL